MKIIVNKDIIEINDNTTLKELIEFLAFEQQQLAVAINNKVITKPHWAVTLLHENDNILIIKAVSGG